MIFYLVLNDGHLTPFQTIKNFLFLTEFGSSNVLTVFKVTATFQTLPSEVVHDDLFNTDNDSSEVFKSRRWNQNRKLLWSRAKLFWYPRSKKAPKLNEEKCSIWKTPSTRRELDTPFWHLLWLVSYDSCVVDKSKQINIEEITAGLLKGIIGESIRIQG